MASNRHLGRIVALQSLYEFDFRMFCGDIDASLDGILERNIERYKKTIDDTDFIKDLAAGVVAKQDELDDVIRPIAPEWPIDQIARIDKTVLRMAIYELKNSDKVPPKVVINEAVELSKAFGGDNSSKFVNGVLGTAYTQIHGDDKEDEKPKKEVKQKPAKSGTKDKSAKKSTPEATATKATKAKVTTSKKSKAKKSEG